MVLELFVFKVCNENGEKGTPWNRLKESIQNDTTLYFAKISPEHSI
jgi:hypothetical protein